MPIDNKKRHLVILGLIAFLLLLSSSAYGQGARFDSVAQKNVQGFLAPIPGATISVCSAAATGTPCAPLVPTSPVTLCTDATCSVAAPNPFLADSNGNFGFWAVAGTTYKVSITASGVTGQLLTVVLPIVSGGAATFTNLTATCTIINAVPCVDTANHAGWTGADACAWINAAQSSATGLNGANGTIDARGLTGSPICAGTLAIGSTTQGVTLLLGGVKLFVQNTVTVAQGSRILGSGNSSGSVGTNPTTIAAGVSFPTSGVYLITAGPASGVADAISVRDIFVDCAGVTGCKGIIAQNIQENSDFTNITITHNLGNGLDITGTSEDFVVQGVNVIAGASATPSDSCFTQTAAANHIQYNTIGCTGQYTTTPSSGAGFLCTNCNAEIIGFHSEAHADQLSLVGASPNHGYVVTHGLNSANNANGVGMTNVIHIQSTWGGTLRASGTAKTVATNTIKNDESAFNHVCTDAVLNKYDLGWATGNPNVIQLDTDCSTLPTIRSATLAISGTTAGNFAPDATALFDIRGPSATFNGVRLTDTTSGNSFYLGPGAGTTGFGIRDQLNSKQLVTIAPAASGATITLPTACATTTAQIAGSPPVLCGITSQKTESAADANVLTFTPPAVAGTYRLHLDGSISAASAATLGWTATWTDSNGNAAAPTNLSVCLASTGVCGATTGALSAVDRFSGTYLIDVNNAAANIVIKLTFSGTSFTAKVSASVERII